MYAIKRISVFTLKVLAKDPKRNYRGGRLIFFYIKVLLSTLKNIRSYRNSKCHVIYITTKKNILFYKDRIKLDFKTDELRNKYLFLVENNILPESRFIENYLQEPYYKNETYKKSDMVLDLIFQNYLKPLYALKLEKSESYFRDLLLRVKSLKLSSEDQGVFESLKITKVRDDFYLTMNHGDFWYGNIVKHKDSYKLIDWDDMSKKSLSFDIFHFYFQEFNADFYQFRNNYKAIKQKILAIFSGLLSEADMHKFNENYHHYVNIFILERLLKRYE